MSQTKIVVIPLKKLLIVLFISVFIIIYLIYSDNKLLYNILINGNAKSWQPVRCYEK